MENPIYIGKNNGNYLNSQQMEMVKKYFIVSYYLGIKDIIQVLKQVYEDFEIKRGISYVKFLKKVYKDEHSYQMIRKMMGNKCIKLLTSVIPKGWD